MSLLDTYRNNPFYLLAASAADSRTALIAKQEDMALFGDDKAADLALAALLNPQTRTEAEIRWFPLMQARETQELIGFFEKHWEDVMMPSLAVPSMLGQFNMLRLALSRLRAGTDSECRAILRSLATAADTLLPAQVMEEINMDRRISGFPEITRPAMIEPPLRDLLNETVKIYLDRMAGRLSDKDLWEMGKAIDMEYKSAASPYHNSYFLEMAAKRLNNGKTPGKSAKSASSAPGKRGGSAAHRFTRTFVYTQPTDTDVQQINEELAKLQLSDVTIRSARGILRTTEKKDGNGQVVSVEHSYCFTSITLNCEERADDLKTWQMAVEIIPREPQKEIDVAAFNENWRATHPDRVLRYAAQYSYEQAEVVVLLYNKRE